jgi:hypothetical protein
MSMYIDLAPYVNPPSYIVPASTCASQTYNLFTSLGLRHLCVVPDTVAVLGVITRKDLTAEHARDVISNKVWTSAEDGGEARAATGLDAAAGPLAAGGVASIGGQGGAREMRRDWDGGMGSGALELQPRPGRVGIVRAKQKP